jgi:hypothetical protein
MSHSSLSVTACGVLNWRIAPRPADDTDLGAGLDGERYPAKRQRQAWSVAETRVLEAHAALHWEAVWATVSTQRPCDCDCGRGKKNMKRNVVHTAVRAECLGRARACRAVGRRNCRGARSGR